MKNLLTIIFLTLSLNCLGQNQSQLIIEQTAQKIGIQNSNIFSRLATSQKFDNGILIVIPEITEKGDEYIIFNSNIILIDDKTGVVKAKFSGENDWYIDAVSIDKIEIEPEIYHLNGTTFAYGLKIFYSGQSRPNPYSSSHLSLFAMEGSELNRVLKDYPIKTFNGETDTTCRGTFEKHSKKMEVLNTYTNQYADLKFTNCIELSKLDEDCEKMMEVNRKEVEILTYENCEYKNVL